MTNAINTTVTRVYQPLTSLEDFCIINDLEKDLIPANRRQVEWDRLRETKAAIADLNDLTQTFKLAEVIDRDQIGGDTQLVQTYLWLCGSYRTRKARRNTRWANPGYVHGDEHIPIASDRATHVEQAMRLPTVSRNDLAERFGITPKALSNWMHEHGYSFRESQRESKERIGRSIKLTAEWSDKTIPECIEIFPAPNRTVRGWVHDRAADMDVPEYPDTARW